MAVFCDKTGVRILPPTGDEKADALKYAALTKGNLPVSVDVDPDNGWTNAPPTPPLTPAQKGEKRAATKTTAAPSVERAPQQAAPAATDAPRKGSK